jgi:hypothetical protein
MQDYIAELEGKLDKLEADLNRQSASDNIHSGSFRLETSKARLDLIWEIQKKLQAYSTPFKLLSGIWIKLEQMNTS